MDPTKQEKKSCCSMKRGRPFASVANFSGFMIYKMAQYLQEEFDSYFEELQIKGRHFVVLHVLMHEGPLAQQQLCDGLWIDRATMVGVIQKLGRMGLVKKKVHPEDKRSYLVSITEKGLTLYRKYQDSFATLERSLLPTLSEGEVKELKSLLRKAMAALCSDVENQ